MSNARSEVADSEDEDETLLLHSPLKDDMSNLTAPDSNKQSTASTTQQLRSAHRHLAEAMTDSPALASAKRRSTASGQSSTTPCDERKPKRVKTYSGKHSTIPREGEDAAFAAFCAEESPQRLPGASAGFGDDTFREHEPQVMFRDTGSTVPDHQSSLPHTLEQPINTQRTPTANMTPASKESSSFPRPRTLTQPESVNAEPQPTRLETAEPALPQPIVNAETLDTPLGNADAVGHALAEDGAATDMPLDQSLPTVLGPGETCFEQRKPTSSPYIVIESRKRKSEVLATQELSETTSNSKGRRTSAPDDSLLSSDELIGLPKEMYKPRPTSCRATQISDAAIDYGQIPEKAAKKKAKRNKTVDATAATIGTDSPANDEVALQPAQGAESIALEPVRRKRSMELPTSPDPTHRAQTPQQSVMSDIAGRIKAGKEKPCPQSEAYVWAENNAAPPASPTAPSTQERRNDKDGFAIPMSVTRSSGRARRCQTTIYEDHTEFRAVPKSPSLQQQQAIRKQALKDVRNEAGRKGKKTTISIADSDDEEDELSKIPGDENISLGQKIEANEEEPPKKRGRGRPKKVATPAATTTVALAAESASVEDEQVEAVPVELAPDDKHANNATNVVEDLSSDTASAGHTEDEAPARSTPAAKAVHEKPHQTPAPKPVDSGKPTTTHSPIASLISVQYRVGLSKRQRIPSLLRTRKPMQPRKTA